MLKLISILLLVFGTFESTAFSQDSVDVTFNYTVTGTVTSVALVGEFNEWNTTEWPMTAKGNGLFERTARLQIGGPAGEGGVAGAYMYKFFTGESIWPNDPLNPYSTGDNYNNSIIYVQDPTIYHLLPNQLVGTIRTSRPTITASLFPAVKTVLDTLNMTLRVDSVTYSHLGGYYDFNTRRLSYTLPSVLLNGTHKMQLTIGSVMDSTTFSVAANPVQIVTPPFNTRKPVYVTAGFFTRPDGMGVDSSITSATISVNGSARSISVCNGIFLDSTALVEGNNRIVVSTTNGGDSVLVTRIMNHTPWAKATAQLSGNSVILNADSSTDPDGQTLTNFKWLDDDLYSLGLNGRTGSNVSVTRPAIPGEYYFGLIVMDSLGNADTTRSYFIVNSNDSISNPTIASNPEWAKRARIYFLFPKAASSAGTINAAAERLTIIRDMGFNVIWMMPVMTNAYPINNDGGPGYNIIDFYNVAPEYGTNQDFKNFVYQAHSLGLKVILDVTPNHSSRFHPWSADAHTNKQKSPYWNWYEHNNQPSDKTNGLGSSLDADGFNFYSGFSDQLLNLNWTDIDMQSEMIDIYKYWIKEFGVDGYRFDVYWGPHRRYGEQYMGKPVRDALKHIKPDILLLAEDAGTGDKTETIYADYSSGGINGGVDAAYDFKLFFNQIRGFGFYASAVNYLDGDIVNNGYYPGPNSLYMRFMESQDEDRIAYAYSSNGSIDATTTFMRTMPMASTIFTVPGIPMIWNGQEVGKGYGDGNFDSRRRGVIDWNYQGKTLLIPHYQRLAQIRGQFKAFTTQKIQRINSSDELVYAFTRPYTKEDGIVAVNFGESSTNVTLSFSVSDLGGWVDEGKSYIASDLYNGGTDSVRITGGSTSLNLTLAPYGTAIFVLADSAKQVNIPLISGIEPHSNGQNPTAFKLYQNYPNPFNPGTTILFNVPTTKRMSVRVFNILGEEIAVIADGIYPAGTHRVQWDGRTRYNGPASSGIYFIRLEAGTFMETKKIILIR
ncbi:MAG: alpha-amylase family glycosyl hydrolase [Bacteroidota bacterium]